jgi:hypothetical protein
MLPVHGSRVADPGERGQYLLCVCPARPGELPIGRRAGDVAGRARDAAPPARDDARRAQDARGAAQPAWRARRPARRPGLYPPASSSRARPGSARCAAGRRSPAPTPPAAATQALPHATRSATAAIQTGRPPRPAREKSLSRARAPRARGHLPGRGSASVPEPPPVPGPPSAMGIARGADAGPGSGWPPPSVRLRQPGPAASIPPGYPRKAGVRPSAGMTPRSVHGETVRLVPLVEPASLLTDRPMRWSGVSTACASRQGTRFVSRPTMLVAQGPAPTEIGAAAA